MHYLYFPSYFFICRQLTECLCVTNDSRSVCVLTCLGMLYMLVHVPNIQQMLCLCGCVLVCLVGDGPEGKCAKCKMQRALP